MNRRRTAAVVGTAAVVVAAAGPAIAWVDVTSTSADVETTAGTLGNPAGLLTALEPADLPAGGVALSWTVPAGVEPLAYRVERQTPGGPWEEPALDAPAACSAGSCSAADTSAQPGATYRYRVRSVRGQWVSEPGDVRLAASLVPARARQVVDTSGLRALAVTPPDLGLLAVGDGGLVLACEGACTAEDPSDWRPFELGTTADLRAVDAPTRDEAWIVGAGVAWRCDEDCVFSTADWEHATAAEDFLAGRTATSVIVRDAYVAMVVDGAFAYSTDAGATWTTGDLTLPPGTRLHTVAGDGPGRVVVTGSGGYVGTCVVGTGVCGEPGTFAAGSRTTTLVAASWVAAESAVLAVDEDGALWKGVVDGGATSWTPDAAQLGGPPPQVRSAAARAAEGERHVWALSPPVASPGTSAVWHFGSGWARMSTDVVFDTSWVASAGGVPVPVSPSLATGCTAPALRAQVDVPAGPVPAVDPVLTSRVEIVAADPSTTQTRFSVSLDGVTWSTPQTLDTAGATALTLTGLTWDTTAAQTLHVCVQADGPFVFVNRLHIGVQL